MSPDTPDPSTSSGGDHEMPTEAIAVSLEGLLHAFRLEPEGDDLFRVVGEPGRFDRVFGGQTVAQALLAAAATVEGKEPHSIHAYFVEAGAPGETLLLSVDRVRDGRSMSTRRATVTQGERVLLSAIASFHSNPPDPEIADPPPAVPAPAEHRSLQGWARDVPPELSEQSRNWIERPPPLELRLGEPPSFLGGPAGRHARSHWMRLPHGVGDDPLLHTALLAYASDYFLLDMVLRGHPERFSSEGFAGFSLDHSLWFHRPVRFDNWHLHSQRLRAIHGHRGLVEGTIHDEDGRLVATAMQEVLVRPQKPGPT